MKCGIPQPPKAGDHAGQGPVLTPLVEPLRRQVEDTLTSWLVPPPDAEMSWKVIEPGEPLGCLEVRLRQGDRMLVLFLREALSGALWQSDGLQVTCRRVPGRAPAHDELLSSWLGHLGRRFQRERNEVGRADALRSALRQWLIYARHGVEDREYFRLEVGQDGICAVLSVSFRCNQRCHMCWQGRDWPDPPQGMLERWIDELAEGGAEVLSLTGGEPTIHPGLQGLIERAAGSHGLRVHLQTNGVRLADREYLGRLRRAGLGAVFVAFHSADPAVSDALTGAPGTHAKSVRGIRNALEAGLEVYLVCCVDKTTVTGLEEHAKYIAEHFQAPFPHNPIRLVDYAQPGNYDPEIMRETLVSFDEVRPHLTRAGRALKQAGIPFGGAGPCGFPMCIFRDDPPLPRWRVHEVPEGEVDWRVFVQACGSCAARRHCHGLRHEYVRIHGTRGVVPFDRVPEPGD